MAISFSEKKAVTIGKPKNEALLIPPESVRPAAVDFDMFARAE